MARIQLTPASDTYIDTGMFASSEDFPISPSTGFRWWCHPRCLYQDDELVSYWVPCRRLTDGAVGYYDIIKDQFYRLTEETKNRNRGDE